VVKEPFPEQDGAKKNFQKRPDRKKKKEVGKEIARRSRVLRRSEQIPMAEGKKNWEEMGRRTLRV